MTKIDPSFDEEGSIAQLNKTTVMLKNCRSYFCLTEKDGGVDVAVDIFDGGDTEYCLKFLSALESFSRKTISDIISSLPPDEVADVFLAGDNSPEE